jgi:GNAT superfamily N-acetyltransferase
MSDSVDNSDAPSLIVRSIAPTDAKAVAKLSDQLGYQVSVEAIYERVAQMPSRMAGHVAFVASLNKTPVAGIVGWIEASLIYEIQAPPYALITGLVVSEAHRSLGIGKRLCAKVEAWSREQGVTKIRVTSRISRERAHRFYLREGFERIKTWAVFEKMLS